MANILRDFVYLDWERVRSLAAQLFRGVPENLTTETGKEASIGAEIEGGILGFLKGQAEGDYRYFRTQNETRSFHHYVYSLVEERLAKDRLLTPIDADFDYNTWTHQAFRDGQFVKVIGIIRLIDYSWTMGMLETMPRIMETALHMSRLESQKKQDDEQARQNVGRQEKTLKDMKAMNLGKVAEVVRTLYGDTIRVKVLPNKNYPDKIFSGAGNQDNFYDTAASLSQKYGYEVDANWVTLGQVNLSNSSTEPLPLPIGNQMEDALEIAVLKINEMARVISSTRFPAVSITPISIYRTIR